MKFMMNRALQNDPQFKLSPPAKAGVQGKRRAIVLDPRFRGDDNGR